VSNIDLDVKTVMLQEERTLRELQELKDGMNKLLSMVVSHEEMPEWLTLEQATALKGVNFNTTKCNVLTRPGAGNPKLQRYCNGRLMFHRDVVKYWMQQTDETMLRYITETCGITHIPEEYRKKLEQAARRFENSSQVPQKAVV